MLAIKKLHYAIARKTLLKDFSLSLQAGEFHVLLGPNGAGKSTLLSLISRDLLPASGEIYLQDKPLDAYSLNELSCMRSVLLQENHFSFSMTVREVCSLGRSPYIESKLSYDDGRLVDESLDTLELMHLADTQFTELSGGEKQRLHIARVLCQNTDLIILDEPMNSLDIKHQILLMTLLQKKLSKGKSILAVMHDINIALRYASHITLLKQGCTIFQGEVASISSAKVFEECFELNFQLHHESSTQAPQLSHPKLI